MVLINGNNVTLVLESELDVIVEIQKRKLGLRQFAGMAQPDGTINLSFPMNSSDRSEFAAYIHRYNAEQRAKNPHLDTKGPGPKGTPPAGGTPGAARVTKFENTIAIAA